MFTREDVGTCTRVGKRGCQQSRGPCWCPPPRKASPCLALLRAESQVQPPTEAAAPCVWQESLKAQVRTLEGLGDGAIPKEKGGPGALSGRAVCSNDKAPELCPLPSSRGIVSPFVREQSVHQKNQLEAEGDERHLLVPCGHFKQPQGEAARVHSH